MLKSTELLSQIYQELYRQESVLPDAPKMTLPKEVQKAEVLEVEKAHQETCAVIAYLLGKKDITNKDWNTLLDLTNQYYDTQPEWKKMLLDFLEYKLQKETEENQAHQAKLISEIQELVKKES